MNVVRPRDLAEKGLTPAKPKIDRSDTLWFKTAVFYEAHIKAFFDGDNDGVGDFKGLTSKLDYLKDLGITALWLLPFYPSPLRDDGYDIAGYRAVNPAYGTMRDFRAMVRACHDRGIRVVTELVVNHTSDQHPWFQRARRAKKGSVYRDFYVWSDTDQQYRDARIIFVDSEKSNWTWDPVAKAYYWHRFYAHQPDLNFDNPRVLEEVISVMRYWLDMGVDGLRLDAVPYLVERDGTSCENLADTHAVIRKIRAVIDQHYPDRVLLAEANQWPEDAAAYFGAGDECHMCFHFPLMPRMYMAIAQEDRHPITDIMRQTPEIPANCQWATFLRNHDELTLEMVTSRERDYLWSFFAADRKMRINLGIRRRLAPLLDNDRRKIELMNCLLLSMPGTPVLYYGDEIGMGDNVYLGDRDGVRTPMQWSPDRNGGFSRADPARLYLPSIMDAIYSYEAVNVEAQTRSPSSLLNWMKRMISMRRQHKALQSGGLRFLYPGNRKVLAFMRETEDEAVLCVANLAHSAQAVELDLKAFKGRVPVEMLGRSAFPPIGDLPYLVTLPAYGFMWFVLPQAAEAPLWHAEAPPPLPDFVTIVVRDEARLALVGREARLLEEAAFPAYLPKQRWFGAKDERDIRVRIAAASEFASERGRYALVELVVEAGQPARVQRYFTPLALSWDEDAGATNWPLLPYTVARARRHARMGAVYEAAANDQFALAMAEAIRARAVVQDGDARVEFHATEDLGGVEDLPPDAGARRLGGEQSNTSLLLGERLMLKLYRRLADGEHPEVEMCRHLTAIGYRNTPRLLGWVERREADGTRRALAVMHEFVRSQGDGWTHALNYLDRVFDAMRQLPAGGHGDGGAESHAIYYAQIKVLARRVAEMHRALAQPSDDPAFAPEPITAEDRAAWRRAAEDLAEAAFAGLQKAQGQLDPATALRASKLGARRKECLDAIRRLSDGDMKALKTRIHGDLHLGQVLVVQNDFHVIDFEGEPMRPLEERRAKDSPLRDVAGMLRSFHYAAWSALYALGDRDPDGLPKLAPFAAEFRQQTQTIFQAEYAAAMEGCPSWPSDLAEMRRTLALFLLHKALYELNYEAANRVNWLRIPIAGLHDLLDGLHAEEGVVVAA